MSQRQFAWECNFLASRMFFFLSFWMLFFHNSPKNPVIKFHKFHFLWRHTLELYGYYQIQCKCILADHLHRLPAINGLQIPFSINKKLLPFSSFFLVLQRKPFSKVLSVHCHICVCFSHGMALKLVYWSQVHFKFHYTIVATSNTSVYEMCGYT